MSTTTAIDAPIPMDKALTAVLSGLLASAQAEAGAAYQAVAQTPAAQSARAAVQAGDLAAFERAWQASFDEVTQGLLDAALPGHREAQFLFQQYAYVLRQFRAVFEKFEGAACCADKARFVTTALLRYYLSGHEVVFDYEQQYTFHLPTKTFRSQAELVPFFDALRAAYYGRTEQLLQAWLEVAKRCS